MGLKPLFTVALACGGILFAPGASAANVQKHGLKVPKAYSEDLKATRDIFETSYAAYKKYAFGHDDLTPVTKVNHLAEQCESS